MTVMGRYLLRRLLIAIPSLLGISVILFTVLALAPGDPFGELATNPSIPPEVRMALREKFGIDDPVAIRYLRWITAMVQGDWGFSFASRINVDTLILQRLPATLFVIGSAQLLALLIAMPVGVLAATQALFDLRSGHQHARLRRLLAADLLHRPAVHPHLQRAARLAALRLSATSSATGWRWYWEHLRQAIMPVCGARPVPGRLDDALRALGRARRDPARLCDDRARQGPRRAHRDRQARGAQRAHSRS